MTLRTRNDARSVPLPPMEARLLRPVTGSIMEIQSWVSAADLNGARRLLLSATGIALLVLVVRKHAA
jgi:hypothetical protein